MIYVTKFFVLSRFIEYRVAVKVIITFLRSLLLKVNRKKKISLFIITRLTILNFSFKEAIRAMFRVRART